MINKLSKLVVLVASFLFLGCAKNINDSRLNSIKQIEQTIVEDYQALVRYKDFQSDLLQFISIEGREIELPQIVSSDIVSDLEKVILDKKVMDVFYKHYKSINKNDKYSLTSESVDLSDIEVLGNIFMFIKNSGTDINSGVYNTLLFEMCYEAIYFRKPLGLKEIQYLPRTLYKGESVAIGKAFIKTTERQYVVTRIEKMYKRNNLYIVIQYVFDSL